MAALAARDQVIPVPGTSGDPRHLKQHAVIADQRTARADSQSPFFKHLGDVESALRASVHWAIEESRYDVASGEMLFRDVRDKCRRVDRARFPELHAITQIAEQTILDGNILTASAANTLSQMHAGTIAAPMEQIISLEKQVLERIPGRMMVPVLNAVGFNTGVVLETAPALALLGSIDGGNDAAR